MEGAARPGLTSTTWSALGDVNRLAGTAAPELCQCALKLGEEVGELCRAVRKLQGQPQDPAGRTADVGDEAADALILLMSIVNRCGINLEDAFRAKEARNESRVWI